MRDVTGELLRDSASGPGERPALVARAKAPKEISPKLAALLEHLADPRRDLTMGFISKALAYSKAMPSGKSEHADMIRLIRSGLVRVFEVNGKPPDGSVAAREAPYNDRYYAMRIGAAS